jgi:two-component system sensor histidine kinase MprB
LSLRRRIALAAAAAVAAAAVAVAVIGYTTTRSHLIGEVKSALTSRAQGFLAPHGHGGGGDQGGPCGGPGPPGPEGQDFQVPGQPFGGAQGAFQVVDPSGQVCFSNGGQLPVGSDVLNIARRRGGSTFYDTYVGTNHTHVEIYAVWDGPDQHVVQVALPLTDDDKVLRGLLLPYGLLIGIGVLLAALLGLAISRSALAPIERFTARTERVASELDRPARLEETGAVELRRLATSFNQTLDALERSIEAQRHLVADASHELRTPIAALRSNIQIFLDADRLPARERVGLQESILAELDELTQIVADVVELARGTAPDIHAEPVELDTIVRQAVDRTQRRAPALRFNLELEQTVVRGVPERVARAVANMVDNARKWSPPGGDVDITLQGGVLTVRDQGPGFDEQDLPHVFDRFYRAEESRRMPGSGLGLAIVKQAAESHGGRVAAANAPDGGATVSASFGAPLTGSDASPADPVASQAPSA